MSFEDLDLGPDLLKAVQSKGYIAPTPIQSRVIPVILNHQDVLARAQTGTGKTDAFALPIVELLSRQRVNKRAPRALILAPTRELALQVGDCFKEYGRRVSLRCTVVYGGVNISPQIDRLKRGVDVLVATLDGFWIFPATASWICPRSTFWCLTKPTACWIWGLKMRSPEFWI